MQHDASFTLQAGPQAFGDGDHPTTKGMIAALEQIDPALVTPRMACDMGCGSGIVAFAAIQRFNCIVVAVDISEQAVEAVRANALANGLENALMPIRADGFAHPDITANAPFDLILMNILADPLVRLATVAERSLAHDGVLILSGILLWQEQAIRDAYSALGLELTSRLSLGDWVTLVWQKP